MKATLLDTLYGQPVRTVGPGRIETPLGDWGLSPAQKEREAHAQACATYREKHREACNARVRAWKQRQREGRA